MIIPCPNNCQSPVIINSPPVRGPNPNGTEAWICLWCEQVICSGCYVKHTEKEHPEKYGLPTSGHKKNKKK